MRTAETEISGIGPPPLRTRIAVVLEPGRRGAAALAQAATLAAAADSEVTVVALAPTADPVCRSCGGVSTRAYNCAVRDEVAESLDRAVATLGGATEQIAGRLLVEGEDPPLDEWVARRGIDLVLLPARRGVPRTRRHPAERRLRRTGAAVSVVSAPRRHLRSLAP
jgi:hypothetical protein